MPEGAPGNIRVFRARGLEPSKCTLPYIFDSASRQVDDVADAMVRGSELRGFSPRRKPRARGATSTALPKGMVYPYYKLFDDYTPAFVSPGPRSLFTNLSIHSQPPHLRPPHPRSHLTPSFRASSSIRGSLLHTPLDCDPVTLNTSTADATERRIMTAAPMSRVAGPGGRVSDLAPQSRRLSLPDSKRG